ncbi:MAG TPA: EF-hand domain-containing protein [Caulobacteraceae bacterium]
MNMTRRQSLAWMSLFVATAPLLSRAVAAAAGDDDEDSIPNVFISPCGQPFRAKVGQPYPVAAWFKQADTNGDGKLDRNEFVADAAAFFKILDLNHDGFLSPPEVASYERRIAPEILGRRVSVSRRSPLFERDGARLWLAQIDRPGEIDPGGNLPNAPHKPKGLDESSQGASPYSLFDEPEPVMAADLDFTGIIRQSNFLKLADAHFTTLDRAEQGFLTLAGLPMTPIQARTAKRSKRRSKEHASGTRLQGDRPWAQAPGSPHTS